MGLLSKLFGGGEDYPSLPQDGEAMAKLETVREELVTLTNKVNDHLEVVPAEHTAYVFLGKPPKRFGLAWIHDGKISSLKEMIDDNHLTPSRVEQLIDELRQAYSQAGDAPRYTARVDGKELVVIPSEALGHEVHDILEAKLH